VQAGTAERHADQRMTEIIHPAFASYGRFGETGSARRFR